MFDPGFDRLDGLLGEIVYDLEHVAVRKGRPADELRETLLHEVLHAVDNAAGTSVGEPVVNGWAPILLDALRRNPELVALLLADD